MNKQYVSLFFMAACLAGMAVYLLCSYEWPALLMVVGGISMGFFLIVGSSITAEEKLFTEGKYYEIEGRVSKVQVTEYAQWVVVEEVHYKQGQKWHPLRNKVELRMPLEAKLTENDLLAVKAEKLAPSLQMNPSDFNTPLYLKAQGIAAAFKGEQVRLLQERTTFIEKLRAIVSGCIEARYHPEAAGIMKACLLGEDEGLDQSTEEIYNLSGIGHVLCISGFHVGVVISALIIVIGWLPVPYEARQLILIGGILFYAVFTGGSISTVRAVIMACMLLGGRILWQEEDRASHLAMAAGIILFMHPYQLFQAGFQLSFAAVGSLIIIQGGIEKKDFLGRWHYTKWQKDLILCLGIQLFTWPILAYHFYEIPFGISLINLAVIPLFSVIIIGGWLSIFLFKISLFSGLLAGGIEAVLWGISQVVKAMLKWPLATLCVGRPTLLQCMIYGSFVLLLLARLYERQIKKACQCGIYIGGLLQMLISFCIPSPLKINALYVGQGDGLVIETPKHQMIVIDGGNKGQGKTIMRFLKYRGSREIAAMCLSHSDADHINGLIEIIESDFKVKQLFISQTDDSKLMDGLLALCEGKKIKVIPLEAGDRVEMGKVTLDCLAPSPKQTLAEGCNDCSLVQCLTYGSFQGIFMGDRSYQSESRVYDQVGPITLLKVSHHGSRTGTDDALLLKLQPSYAMISCGRNNLYGHPHEEVVEMLGEHDVTVDRTDREGAICYETNGSYLIKHSFRKEVSSCP